MKNKPIIIVGGEPNSVFFEIYLKALSRNRFKKPNLLIASKELLLSQMAFFKCNVKVNIINKNKINFGKLKINEINIINVELKFKNLFEKITSKSNKYIEQCFKISLKLLKTNNFAGMINGPISKKSFLKGKNLGITEYLAQKTKRKNNIAMLIFNKKLSVSPITTHLALKNVHKHVSKQKICTHIKLITEFYEKNFKKKPKIAITGLNPHCESNFKNCEENATIIPAIKNLKTKHFNVEGPFPADTIFIQDHLKKFDVIVGMYHDQVLTPMKALFGFDAINITLGLPFVRISPDHGPNSSMLGKNLSDPKSLIKALKFLDK
jgi:4-hydroxythreonine-4-phosphate dehydrogenase